MQIPYIAILIIRMNLIQNSNISILRFAKEEISFTYHWQEIFVQDTSLLMFSILRSIFVRLTLNKKS